MRKWVGLREIAARYGVSSHTVYKWTQKGIIPFGRAGNRLIFDVAETDSWARQRGNPGRLDFPVSDEQAREQEAGRIAERIMATS